MAARLLCTTSGLSALLSDTENFHEPVHIYMMNLSLIAAKKVVYSAWPIILVHMILYIDAIGPKPQQSKQKPRPILYIVAYPILASSEIAVWLSSQTGSDFHTDKPHPVTRQRALTTS
jgi:hypothetical protein